MKGSLNSNKVNNIINILHKIKRFYVYKKNILALPDRANGITEWLWYAILHEECLGRRVKVRSRSSRKCHVLRVLIDRSDKRQDRKESKSAFSLTDQ